MKQIRITLVLLVAIAAIIGCKGNDGATGPTGNANVLQFEFQYFAHNGTTDLPFVIPVRAELVEKSAILMYVQPAGAFYWIQIPGYVGTMAYQLTIDTLGTDSTVVKMARRVGTGGQEFWGARILVIPANVLAKPVAIDWNNYAEVARYFNLPQ